MTNMIIVCILIGYGIGLTTTSLIIGLGKRKKEKEVNDKIHKLENEIHIYKANFKDRQNQIENWKYRFAEANRINEESEQNLRNIITESDKELAKTETKWRELTEKLHSIKDVKEYCKQAWKEARANNSYFENWWKEFKENI